jgi:hypothetical protein
VTPSRRRQPGAAKHRLRGAATANPGLLFRVNTR